MKQRNSMKLLYDIKQFVYKKTNIPIPLNTATNIYSICSCFLEIFGPGLGWLDQFERNDFAANNNVTKTHFSKEACLRVDDTSGTPNSSGHDE